jgi:hypothetical protein
MYRYKTLQLAAALGFAGVTAATGFSLIGPYDAWQIEQLGYQFAGDMGGPKMLAEEYRVNVSDLTYAFDESFINFFGERGMREIEKAMAILNGEPPTSKMSKDLDEYPLNGARINARASALGIMDLKTEVMGTLLEQVGLGSPERFVWTLNDRLCDGNVPHPILYSTVMRNFDPVTWSPSRFVNGSAFTYTIRLVINNDSCESNIYEAIPIPVDPTSAVLTSLVSWTGIGGGSVGRNYFSFAALPLTGVYYNGLTRDDAGGLRYLMTPGNMNTENLIPSMNQLDAPTTNVVVITTNSLAAASTNIFVSSFNVEEGSVALSWAQETLTGPSNDNFASASTITGTRGSVSGSNISATAEAGESMHADKKGGASVWFNWQAPLDGVVVMDTIGSTFDTLLEVYTGSDLATLTRIQQGFQVYAASDDLSTDLSFAEGAAINQQSLVSFNAVAGQTYRIAVDGTYTDRDGKVATGYYNLNWIQNAAGNTPQHNNLSNAIALSGLAGSVAGSNQFANNEFGERDHASNTGGASVWYSWTPTASGPAIINTQGSRFDTLLAIYTGSAHGNLTVVAESDDVNNGDRVSEVNFVANQGTRYLIAVDGFSNNNGDTSEGVFLLNWIVNGLPATNNSFAGAQTLTGSEGRVFGSNINANRDQLEPQHNNTILGKSIWYRWVAPVNGAVKFSTAGSSIDTVLGVYTGNMVSSLSEVKLNDDINSNFQTSEVEFDGIAGSTYYIAIDGYADPVNSNQLLAGLGVDPSTVTEGIPANLTLLTQNDPFQAVGANFTGSTGNPFDPVGSGGTGGGVTNIVVSTNAFVNNALRAGMDKISFKPVEFDSLLGQTFTPVTNTFNDVMIESLSGGSKGLSFRKQRVSRVTVLPDILFTASDLGPTALMARTAADNWTNNDAINGVGTGGGPGVIDPNIVIDFNKLVPTLINDTPGTFPGATEDTGVAVPLWGSYDGSTNAPSVYPIGTELQEIEQLVFRQ